MSICANPECGKEFEQPNKYRTAKTCSKECRYAVSASTTKASSGRWETKVCPCGVEFQSAVNKPKTYHDWDCMMKHRQEDARASRTCENPECGKEFTYFKRQNQRTCSPECRNKVTAMKRENNYPECQTCGVSTGSYNRIYCDEHRPNRPGRKPAPRITATCLCCGEEFTRPENYPGKMKYCSNACSHRQVKKVRDKFIADLPEGAIVFHSGWEIRFWAACLRFDIPIRSYDGPDIETSQGVYRPDFIIGKPNEERVVDVKGWLRPESEVKCREAGVHLVTKQELLRLESGDSLDAHRALLWNSGMNTHTAPLY
ncbi:hypothetical protein SEA_DIRTMONSTER_94 [Mycobacterium phage DirtMonster]|uniref:Uncharacterized protein n=1 Tax=Mycobacterium phage CharlieB TaxID=2301609 RepID=A0A3G3BZ75_9CAUD|nr:HNH endonuclease [Mycobacterium phage CharlieB]ATN87546.1 hypothetical protein SEA_BEANWATER_92 [Mycobacterium phage BeanWater]AYP69516.1 hypothetical protein SEA_CHARLIEB_96 [Mycobacterium phage CharlieB]QAY05053.1 hypothetical protein SEA_SHAQNATO_93 [Mycobacterium phage Shaqnato]